MISQIVSLGGAGLILGAYFAFQRGWIGREHRSYHVMNFVGAALLTYVAIEDRRAGFIVLESVWAILSLPGAIRPPRASRSAVE